MNDNEPPAQPASTPRMKMVRVIGTITDDGWVPAEIPMIVPIPVELLDRGLQIP